MLPRWLARPRGELRHQPRENLPIRADQDLEVRRTEFAAQLAQHLDDGRIRRSAVSEIEARPANDPSPARTGFLVPARQQTRLADARIPADQNGRHATMCGRLKRLVERGQFGGAPDEIGLGLVPRVHDRYREDELRQPHDWRGSSLDRSGRAGGAGDGIRTRDILLGKQTLCQLSYSRSGGRTWARLVRARDYLKGSSAATSAVATAGQWDAFRPDLPRDAWRNLIGLERVPEPDVLAGKPQGIFVGRSLLTGRAVCLLFLDGGRVTRSIPSGGLEQFDWVRHNADHPGDSGMWEMLDDELSITWGDGGVHHGPLTVRPAGSSSMASDIRGPGRRRLPIWWERGRPRKALPWEGETGSTGCPH